MWSNAVLIAVQSSLIMVDTGSQVCLPTMSHKAGMDSYPMYGVTLLVRIFQNAPHVNVEQLDVSDLMRFPAGIAMSCLGREANPSHFCTSYNGVTVIDNHLYAKGPVTHQTKTNILCLMGFHYQRHELR